MKVRNIGTSGRSIAVPNRPPLYVEAGETVEVDDDLGQALLDQPDRWGPAGRVPDDSTVPAIVAWVGDDKTRARKALDEEQAKDKPRATLIGALESIINAEEN